MNQSLTRPAAEMARRVRKLNHLLDEKGGVEAFYRSMIANGYSQDEIADELGKVDSKELKVATLRFWVTTYGWNRPAHEGKQEALGVA